MLQTLTESYAWIQQQALPVDACFVAGIYAFLQKRPHLGDHVGIDGIVLHGPRFPTHMHDAGSRIGLGHGLPHPGVPQTGHVVHQVAAGLQRETRNLGLACIHGDDRIKLAQAFDDGDHTRALDRYLDWR